MSSTWNFLRHDFVIYREFSSMQRVYSQLIINNPYWHNIFGWFGITRIKKTPYIGQLSVMVYKVIFLSNHPECEPISISKRLPIIVSQSRYIYIYIYHRTTSKGKKLSNKTTINHRWVNHSSNSFLQPSLVTINWSPDSIKGLHSCIGINWLYIRSVLLVNT